MSTAPRAIRVFLPCTGLGREVRGFEAFTRECAEALRDRQDLAVTVFGGGGELLAGERFAWNLPRASSVARLAGQLVGRDPYFIEQVTFALGFIPALMAGSPDVVYFADLNLGNALWHWRRLTRSRYRLLYYNGGPTTRPFTRCDVVQQVSPEHLEAALARGEPAGRQVLLPHGIAVDPVWRPAGDAERVATRRRLGVPETGLLMLSVGALNASHKRMDAVIRATARLAAPRPHLLLLGATTRETAAIRALAASVLGAGCTVATVSRDETLAAYRAADAFVLASLNEGFGLAFVEALAAGLPCVAHATPTTSFVLGEHGIRADIRDDGILADRIADALRQPGGPAAAMARHAWVRDQFSWERLVPRYADLLVSVGAGRLPAER